ncbi:hypothetical protein E2C01_010286 [Portunus trituberculatus]|uniref:Uncharacterized protein n=1 Tax=Portunus trituberculatus TaxID=210409 RepID=A0A5B7D7Z0_PORTR|nr:hypothetical protein [Portunus trituberculatus]
MVVSYYQLMVDRNCKLKYSRNRFLGRTEPSEPVLLPVPRGIGRTRLMNTEYQSIGTASELLDEYQARWRFRDWYSSVRGTGSGIVSSGESGMAEGGITHKHSGWLRNITTRGGRFTGYRVVRYRSSEPRNVDSPYLYFRA